MRLINTHTPRPPIQPTPTAAAAHTATAKTPEPPNGKPRTATLPNQLTHNLGKPCVEIFINMSPQHTKKRRTATPGLGAPSKKSRFHPYPHEKTRTQELQDDNTTLLSSQNSQITAPHKNIDKTKPPKSTPPTPHPPNAATLHPPAHHAPIPTTFPSKKLIPNPSITTKPMDHHFKTERYRNSGPPTGDPQHFGSGPVHSHYSQGPPEKEIQGMCAKYTHPTVHHGIKEKFCTKGNKEKRKKRIYLLSFSLLP